MDRLTKGTCVAITSWCPLALRTRDANARSDLHVLACTLTANVQRFHNQLWPFLYCSASKYGNSVRWRLGEAANVRKGQRVKTDITNSLHPSIYPSCPRWFNSPSCHFSTIIADDITAACGAALHLEVKLYFPVLKTNFPAPIQWSEAALAKSEAPFSLLKKLAA